MAKLAVKGADRLQAQQPGAERSRRARLHGLPRTGISASSALARVSSGLEEWYMQLVQGCRGSASAASLRAAREFGREALSRGLTVVEVVVLHDRVCRRFLAAHQDGDVVEWAHAAHKLLAAALTPFERIHMALRAANAAVRESGQRYHDLFEGADVAIVTLGLDGRVTAFNRAAELLTGYGREEVLSRAVDSIIATPKIGLARRSGQLRLRKSEGPSRFELDLVTRDGRCVAVETGVRPVHDGGKLTGFQAFIRDVSDRKQAEVAARHLAQHLERKARRISRALHDEAGQVLASLYLRVEEVASELPAAERQGVHSLRAMLDQVYDQLRRLAHELRPSVLDDYGLQPACRFLAEGVAKRTGIAVAVNGASGGRLPSDVETASYRVVQEALNNIVKHAKATKVTIDFERQARRLIVSIHDDGTAFDVDKVMARRAGRGLGLAGMQEHLMAVAGHLKVTSAPDRGTSVEFAIPLEN